MSFYCRYTKRIIDNEKFVYAVVLKWPKGNKLFLEAPVTTLQTSVHLLGYKAPMKWTKGESGGINIEIPFISYSDMPCKWSWVFKISNLANA